jgi:hypothetical protein
MMIAMARKINRISGTLIRILKERGLEGRLSEYHIFGQWDKAVGAVIARHARPHAVHGKKLTLIVDSPAWMQQLSLLKPELVEKVNKSLGKDAIKDIVLKLGEVAPSAASPETPLIRAGLSREERATIETCLQEISDPDTREAIQRVIEKDFLSRKSEKK